MKNNHVVSEERLVNEINNQKAILDAAMYNIRIWSDMRGFTDEEVISLENILWDSQREHLSISFLIAQSSWDDVWKDIEPWNDVVNKFDSVKKDEKKVKRFLPKNTKIVHIYAIGTNKTSAYKYANEVKENINKNFPWCNVFADCCGKDIDILYRINEYLKEADGYRAAGRFDFYACEKEQGLLKLQGISWLRFAVAELAHIL